MTPSNPIITDGFCQCGCGQKTTVATRSDKKYGAIKGQPRRFVLGHWARTQSNISNTPTYSCWSQMKRRCECPKNKAFRLYGARGIKVCDRWNKFSHFLDDMGEKPKGLMIERIDNDGNYEPSNCRWATQKEQSRNRRTNRVFIWNGIPTVLMDISIKTKIRFGTLRDRIVRQGMSLESAIAKGKGR